MLHFLQALLKEHRNIHSSDTYKKISKVVAPLIYIGPFMLSSWNENCKLQFSTTYCILIDCTLLPSLHYVWTVKSLCRSLQKCEAQTHFCQGRRVRLSPWLQLSRTGEIKGETNIFLTESCQNALQGSTKHATMFALRILGAQDTPLHGTTGLES